MKLLDIRVLLYDYMGSILIFQKNSKYFEYKFKKTNSTVRLEFRLNCSAVSNRKYCSMQKLQFVTGSPIWLKP
jgi:hypothetical protein